MLEGVIFIFYDQSTLSACCEIPTSPYRGVPIVIWSGARSFLNGGDCTTILGFELAIVWGTTL